MKTANWTVGAGILLAALVASWPAGAQDQRPCKADEERLCAGVDYGQGRVRACLESHSDQLSPECKAVLASSPQLQQVEIPPDPAAGNVHLKGWLLTPKTGPHHGAVVILHGCNGLNQGGWRHALQWAYWFNRQGQAALILDSFSPRGLDNICGAGGKLPGQERAQDLAAAARYLSAMPDIAADGIAAIGFSHGGWTVVEAAFTPAGAQYRALIALYPFCSSGGPRTGTAPLLILAGGQDDWTASEPCARLAAQNTPGTPEVRIKIYPDARHSFDVNRPLHRYFGHLIEYNKAADEDGHMQIAQFLQAHLGKAVTQR